MYFKTQSAALEFAEADAIKRGFRVIFPDAFFGISIYSEQYGKYSFQLEYSNQEKTTRKMLHVTLYRMPSGNYELVHYIN